jgi:hypothetical protein
MRTAPGWRSFAWHYLGVGKSITGFQKAIAKHIPGVRSEFIRTIPSAVTAEWGVKWNEMQIARDVLQNFYDANRARLDEVAVTIDGRDVMITAPTGFDIERLFYLGSDKTGDSVGQYGEGFKAAATCLLRDHGVRPIGVSGNEAVQVRLADEPVSGGFYPLVYDFYRVQPAYNGALMVLNACSPLLVRELHQGMDHFFYENNRLIGPRLWNSWGKQSEYVLYQSRTNDGHVFYRNLKRATIDGLPVVLVIHKPNARIDKKVAQDRDRNAFEDAVLDMCYDVFARQAASFDAVASAILGESKHYWEKGHALLSAIAHHRTRVTSPEKMKALFRDYYASSPKAELGKQLRFEEIESRWKREGKRLLPGYFTAFGATSAATQISEQESRAFAEQRRMQRGLTQGERNGKVILLEVLSVLAPALVRLLEKKEVRYSVADTDAILGALREGQGYGRVDVFLAASVFSGDFPRALAIFCHEHAHMFGYDGERGFTDALTELIEAMARERALLDDYERDWESARKIVLNERRTDPRSSQEPVADRIRSLTREELLSLLEKVPSTVLSRILK